MSDSKTATTDAQYEPGTVAVATVRGVKGVRVFRRIDHHGVDRWETAPNLSGRLGHADSDVTHVRPLVVLDLDALYTVAPEPGETAAQYVVRTLRGPAHGLATRRALADQIEAQTRPPRIPEPGLWGVVEAHGPSLQDGPTSPARWTCVDESGTWRRSDNGFGVGWYELTNPTLIREGLS